MGRMATRFHPAIRHNRALLMVRELQLNTPFRDGTTHVLFSPQDFIARLAALVPRPRVNLTRCHGVFAPISPMRRAIVPTPASARRRRKRKDSAAAIATRQCTPTESRSDCNDPPHRAADLGAAIEARLRHRHHPLPALRRAAARDCSRASCAQLPIRTSPTRSSTTSTAEHPHARRLGAPRRTRTHPICSPNVEKTAETGPPAHINPKLPLSPGDPYGNNPDRRTKSDRFRSSA